MEVLHLVRNGLKVPRVKNLCYDINCKYYFAVFCSQCFYTSQWSIKKKTEEERKCISNLTNAGCPVYIFVSLNLLSKEVHDTPAPLLFADKSGDTLPVLPETNSKFVCAVSLREDTERANDSDDAASKQRLQ